MNTNSSLFPGTAKYPRVHLDPGELHIAWKPTIIHTLLGSCVSIVLHVPKKKVTAICHSLLPSREDDRSDLPFRFVDSSIHHMLSSFKKRGIAVSEIKVKVFGGADMIISSSKKSETIGHQNVLTALKTLAAYGLTVDTSKVGGEKGYKLYVRSDTGEVLLKHVGNP